MIGFAGSWLRGASEATGGEGGKINVVLERIKGRKNERQSTILKKGTDV